MSLIFEEKTVYPMDLRKVSIGDKVIYDRTVPGGPPWIIIELSTGPSKFIPVGSDSFVTADGFTLTGADRYAKRWGAGRKKFVPGGSDSLITADGYTFMGADIEYNRRRRGRG